MATRSCCSIPHTAAAGVRSATSEPAPCRSTKHSNASATIHTSWNYGRPTSERPQLIDTHDEHRSLETTVRLTTGGGKNSPGPLNDRIQFVERRLTDAFR